MTAFLLPEEFSDGEHLRAYEFYTPITTFDSSLGAPVQAIISAREGRLREAWKFFKRNLNVDLEDIQGNVRDGLHMAATGGTWQSLVFGFGGLKIDNGEAWFEPHLPREINGLEFRLRLKESLVSVSFDRKEARYELEKGEEISLRHEYETITLVPGIPVSRSLVPELKSMPDLSCGTRTEVAGKGRPPPGEPGKPGDPDRTLRCFGNPSPQGPYLSFCRPGGDRQERPPIRNPFLPEPPWRRSL